MNYLKEYLESLLEEKPIGEKNKEIWLDYLKQKYSKNNEDLFVSFVSEDKIGINPKSIHQTPNGVYTYPMKFLLDDNKVPFRGTTKPKKIKILKVVSEKVLDNKLTEEQYEELRESIVKKFEARYKNNDEFLYQFDSIEKYMYMLESDAVDKTPFGKLWNVTRRLSKTPNEWTKILIDLGFDWANDKGRGIIHHNEPTQAVFLNPKSYKLIDEEFVDTEERYKHAHTSEILDMNMVRKNMLDYGKLHIHRFLMTYKKSIEKLKISETKAFINLLIRVVYDPDNDFSSNDRSQIITHYYDIIQKKLNQGIHNIDILQELGSAKMRDEFLNYFHKSFEKIIYRFIEIEDNDLFSYISKSQILQHFPDVIKKIISDNKLENLKMFGKEFDNIKQIFKKDIKTDLKESFKISSENVDDYYETFKKSYDSSTGHSWSKEKFIQRSSDWIFFGDSSGFITVRKQKSGFYKITGSAGSPKSILKGLDELISENKPTWTAATESIADMLKKKGFFVAKGILYYPFIKLLIETIPSYVFGDSIEQVKTNGAVVFNVDGHSHEKFFCCNKTYLKELLNSSQTPDKLKQIISKFL